MLLSFVFVVVVVVVVVFALFVCFFFVAKSRSQIFCKTSFSKNAKAMLAMAAIILPLHFFPFPFTRETKLCSYYTGSFLSYKSHYRKRAQ